MVRRICLADPSPAGAALGSEELVHADAIGVMTTVSSGGQGATFAYGYDVTRRLTGEAERRE